jgi:putative DNA-invertase from lambdoid prophage Rac
MNINNIKKTKKNLNDINPAIGYVRVSTSDQEVKNQKYEILEYCRKNNLFIINWVEVEMSSKKSFKERKIDLLLSYLSENNTLICTEISRLGRSTSEVLNLVENMLKEGHRVIFTKKNLDLKGGNDFISKILLTVFSMLAELERDLISLRTKEALASRKSQGVILGKPKGTIQKSIYDNSKNVIVECLKKKMDISNISRFIQIGKPRSLQDYIKKHKLKNKI